MSDLADLTYDEVIKELLTSVLSPAETGQHEDGPHTHRWTYTPDARTFDGWYVGGLDALRDAIRGAVDAISVAQRLVDAMGVRRRTRPNKRTGRHMDARARIDRAHARQHAAIAARMTTPQPVPRDTPLRLGVHTRLTERLVLRLTPRPPRTGQGVAGIKVAYAAARPKRDTNGRGRIRKSAEWNIKRGQGVSSPV